MKIAIIGTGAMGSVYAGLLADSGNEVWAIDTWAEHIKAIQTNGLRVEGASGNRVIQTIQASTSTADIGPCDLVVIATKAAHVGAAAEAALPLFSNQTLILTIQNGLGAAERITQHLSPENVLLGVAGGFGASIKGPGHVHHNGMELIRIGEMQGGLTDRVEKIVQVWRKAGFTVKAYADINQLIWEKFICNVSFSAPCTVFNCTLGVLMNNPHAWKVGLGCGLEAYKTGRAKGVTFSFDDPEAYITAFGQKMPDARPSMLLDHLDKRRSEIDSINGAVPIVAAEVGTTAPYNEVVTAIVKSRELAF
ncbi:MAG: 2-dehydropantoate 2-reductase [Chloroflexota bacterium]